MIPILFFSPFALGNKAECAELSQPGLCHCPHPRCWDLCAALLSREVLLPCGSGHCYCSFSRRHVQCRLSVLVGLLEQHTGLAMLGKLPFIACSSLAQVPSMAVWHKRAFFPCSSLKTCRDEGRPAAGGCVSADLLYGSWLS